MFQVIQKVPNPIDCNFHFELKEHLKSVGWTVPSSGDGTTYNAAGDEITHGGAGAGGMNNTNAWFRLRSPGALPEITMQRAINSTTWRMKLARADMNAGSPSATQTPATTTATDEILVLGGGTDASPTGSASFGGGINGGVHLKGAADDEAPYGFWFASSAMAGGIGSNLGAILLDPLIHTISGDAFTYLMLARVADLISTQLSSGDTPANQFTYLASATPDTALNMPAVIAIGIAGAAIPGDIVTTNDGQFREFMLRYERRAAAASPGYKGVSSLMKWASPSPSRWSPISIDTPSDRIVYGDVTLPWNGEAVLV